MVETKKLKRIFENIENYEGLVKSFVKGTFDKNQILKSLSRNHSKNTKLLPLKDIFFGVKDIINIEGYPTRCGSNLPHELFDGQQASVVNNLLNAGASFIAKTVTAEFAISDPGETRNPRNLLHTPGGSSSGSGAAVAAEFCDFAIGTQTCGSVIRPAGYCGVVGYKPSFDRIRKDGVLLFSKSMDHIGIIAKSIELLEIILPVIVNNWENCNEKNDDQIVLAIPEGSYLNLAKSKILKQFNLTTEKMKSNFEVIKLRLIKNISYYNDLLDKITFAELFSVHSPWFEEYKDLYQPLSKKTLMLGKKISEDELAAYLDEAKLIQNYVQTLMKDSKVDAWIAPVAPDFAPLGLKTTGDYRMNSIWSLTGLPVIAIPTGVNNKNLPYSLQIIGNFGEDEKLLQIAKMAVKNLNISQIQNEWDMN